MGLDSGLFLEGIPKSQQPGTFVRRVNGRTLSDEEVIELFRNCQTAWMKSKGTFC